MLKNHMQKQKIIFSEAWISEQYINFTTKKYIKWEKYEQLSLPVLRYLGHEGNLRELGPSTPESWTAMGTQN